MKRERVRLPWEDCFLSVFKLEFKPSRFPDFICDRTARRPSTNKEQETEEFSLPAQVSVPKQPEKSSVSAKGQRGVM
jgi:hypothetical protein